MDGTVKGTSGVVAGVVLAAVLVAACSDGSGPRVDAAVATNGAQAGGGGWGMLALHADEVEWFDSLAEMGQIADVVVVAQAVGIDGVRRVGPEGDEGVDLAQVRFEVIRAVSDWDEDSIVLEFTLPGSLTVTALEEQVTGFPPTLIAIRHKAGREEGLYRAVNSESLWAEQPGGGLIAPLAEDHEGKPELASELAELESLEELASHLEAARRDCDGECGLSQAAWNR